MEENLNIEVSETNRGKEQIIINKKYKFNYSSTKKDGTKVFRCTEYKTLNRCKSFIILNDEREIIKYDNSHNHLENEIDASISIAKHRIKDEIRKSTDMNIKPKRIYDDISQKMGFLCPEYNTIKSQIARSIRKEQPNKIRR